MYVTLTDLKTDETESTTVSSGIRYDTIAVYQVNSEDDTTATDANKLTLGTDYTIAELDTATGKTETDTSGATVAYAYTYKVTVQNVSTASYYYVTFEDMAGNSNACWIVADNIDTDTPSSPTINVTEGTVGTDTSWYKSGVTVTVQAELPTDSNGEISVVSDFTLNYIVTRDGESYADGTGSLSYSDIKDLADTSPYIKEDSGKYYLYKEISLPNDGQYVINAYTVTGANKFDSKTTTTGTGSAAAYSSTENTLTVKVDQSAAAVSYTDITVKDNAGNALSAIANFFGFGNFFDSADGITVTLNGSDIQATSSDNYTTNVSGISKAYYQLGGTTGTWSDADFTKNADNTFTVSFSLSENDLAVTDGTTIYVKTVDAAGNEYISGALQATKVMDENNQSDTVTSNDSNVWMIDTVNAEINTAEYYSDANHETSITTNNNGYFTASAVYMEVDISDGLSGIQTVSWKVYDTDANGNLLKEDSYDAAGTGSKQGTYAWTYSFTTDGIYYVELTVTDNANNVTSQTYTVKVDSTGPDVSYEVADGASASESVSDIDAYFGGNWYTDNQTVTFTLTDELSGIDTDKITLTAQYETGGTTYSIVDLNLDDADLSAVTGNFVVSQNGTYTLSWSDLAGNPMSDEIVVYNVDTSGVASPAVTVTDSNGTGAVTGLTGSEYGSTNWYQIGGTVGITITPNLTDKDNSGMTNGSDETTYYALWNENDLSGSYGVPTSVDDAKTVYATSVDGKVTENTVSIFSDLPDGIWHLVVWNVDEAHGDNVKAAATYNTYTLPTGASEYVLYVDRTTPDGDYALNPSTMTSKDVKITYTLTDYDAAGGNTSTGSGIDWSSLKLEYQADASGSYVTLYQNGAVESSYSSDLSFEIDQTNGTIAFTINNDTESTILNGNYKLTFSDVAGNANTTGVIAEVNNMDPNSVPSVDVYLSDTNDSTGLSALSDNAVETVKSSAYLLLEEPSYTGTAALTYSATLTDPNGNVIVVSGTTAGETWDSTAIKTGVSYHSLNVEGKWTLTTKTTSSAGSDPDESSYTIIVDDTAPTVTDQEYSTRAWTNADVELSFAAEDPTTNAADTDKTVSGIATIVVTAGTAIIKANSTDIDSVDSLTLYDSSTSGASLAASYSFYATVNGTYTVTVTDKAGNKTEYEFEVTNIDKTDPDAFDTDDVLAVGETGSSNGVSTTMYNYWFKQNTVDSEQKTYVQVKVPEQASSSSVDTTYVVYWPADSNYTPTAYDKNSDTSNGYVVTSFTSETNELTKTVELANGKWNVAVWREDSAGNVVDSSYTVSSPMVVYTDITLPVATFDNTTVSITKAGSTIAEKIGNFLTFGNFFKERFEITLSGITDSAEGDSGMYKVYYYLADPDTDTTDSVALDRYSEATEKSGSYVITVTAAELTENFIDDYNIYVYAEDIAGNITPVTVLQAYQNADATNDKLWMIDTVSPTIGTPTYSATVEGVSVNAAGTDYYVNGYYNLSGTTMNVDVSDGAGSGLYTVEWTVTGTEPDGLTAISANGMTGTTKYYEESSSVSDATWTYTFPKDGAYSVTLTVTDNAGNVTTTTFDSIVIKVDSTAPTGTFTAKATTDTSGTGTTLNDTNSYFTLGTDNWLSEEQTVSFTIDDAFSGVVCSTIKLETSALADGNTVADKSGDDLNLTHTTGTASSVSGSFTISQNGTYTLSWQDYAGNTSYKTIVVTNVDTTDPAEPTVTVNPSNTDDTNGNAVDGTNTLYWYTNESDITTTITTNLKDVVNTAQESTLYTLYNVSKNETATTETYQTGASGTAGTAPSITTAMDDGHYILHVWNEDAAGRTKEATYESGSIYEDGVYDIYVDRNAPSVTVADGQPTSGTTGGSVTMTFTLDDGTGSGVDLSTIALKYVQFDSDVKAGETAYTATLTGNSYYSVTEDPDTGKVTVTYTIANSATYTNGTYTLSWADNAGNASSKDVKITTMASTDLPAATVTYASDVSGTDESAALTNGNTYYLNGKSVYLHIEGEAGTNATVYYYSYVLTAPDGTTYKYPTVSNSATSIDLWIADTMDSLDLAAQEGKWTLVTTTDSNIVTGTGDPADKAEETFYIVIDSSAPVITNTTGDELVTGNGKYPTSVPTQDTWTNTDVALSFAVSDPTDSAEDNPATVSGIATIVVSGSTDAPLTTTAGGSTVTEAALYDSSDPAASLESSYIFYATVNGTYTITVTDVAGNVTIYEFDVTNIDKTAMSGTLDVDVSGTDGTAVDDTEGAYKDQWYKQLDSDSNKGTTSVEITLPEDGTGTGTNATAPYTTYYMYWAKGTTAPTDYLYADESGYTTGSFASAQYDVGETVSVALDDGQWEIAIWVEDEAGNITNVYTTTNPLTVYTDLTQPTTNNYEGISVAANSGKNYLGIGNFFNKGFTITLTGIKDATSGVEAIYYYYAKSTSETAPTAETSYTKVEAETNGSFVITIADEAVLDGCIWVYVKDNAGNVTEPTALKLYKAAGGEDSDKWMIDSKNPTVSTVITSENADSINTGDNGVDEVTGWYNIETGYPVVNATATDAADDNGIFSGIGSLLRTIVKKANQDADDSTYDTEENGEEVLTIVPPTAITQTEYDEDYTFSSTEYGDGVYKVTYDVTDNALNTGTTTTDELKVDMTLPEIDKTSVEIEEKNDGVFAKALNLLTFGNFFKDEIQITMAVEDETSGANKLYYTVLDDADDVPDADTEWESVNVEGNRTSGWTATIIFNAEDTEDLLNGYIWVYAEDVAGNSDYTKAFALKPYTLDDSGSTYWMIDLAEPEITLTMTDSAALGKTASDWYNGDNAVATGESYTYPVVWAVFQEGFDSTSGNVSGINLVTREIQKLSSDGVTYESITAADLEDSSQESTLVGVQNLYSDPTEMEYTEEDEHFSDYLKLGDENGYFLSDGEYIVLYTLTDNAGNTVEQSITVQIDTIVPEGEVTTDLDDLQAEPVNAPQEITVSTSDAMSGVAEVVVTAARLSEYKRRWKRRSRRADADAG
ncbi:MAG: hypothetical protein LUE90_01480 [Clostridiales bacterium]|nr:hypothetical protein [Clostridiales bacterium]